jgi:hypothetical protein
VNVSYNTEKLFFPVILVTLGVVILFHKGKGRKEWHSCKEWRNRGYWENRYTAGNNDSNNPSSASFGCWNKSNESSIDYLDEVNVFGGSERKIYSKAFRGGKVTSIFGGSTYDLLNSELAEGKSVVDTVNIFGGCKMIIPVNWKVHIEVVSIFGGFADKRKASSLSFNDNSRELYITGIAIFGGGEINSI